MASYYVTQTGANTGSGTSLANAKSVANYSSQQTFGGFVPGGGDTIFFSGTITGEIDCFSGGSGNGASRLTLDFTGATLNYATQQIFSYGANYVTFEGGGFWTQGVVGGDSVYHPGCIVGALNANGNQFFYSGAHAAHDVTINGFQCILGTTIAAGDFIATPGISNCVVSNNNVVNAAQFFYCDGSTSNSTTLLNNYFFQSLTSVKQADIVTATATSNFTMQGNKFILRAPGNASGHHNDLFQTFNSASGIIMRYNWLQQSVNTGDGSITFTELEDLSNSAGFAMKVHGNVLYGTSTQATGGFGGGGPGTTPYTIFYYNNTFYRNGGPSSPWGWNGTGSMNFKNNIFASPTSFADGIHIDITAAAPYDYNFFYRWQDPSAAMAGTHGSRVLDPLFTDASNLDFSLSGSSPLIGQADNTIGSEYNMTVAPGSTWPNPTLVSKGTIWNPGAIQGAGVATPYRLGFRITQV